MLSRPPNIDDVNCSVCRAEVGPIGSYEDWRLHQVREDFKQMHMEPAVFVHPDRKKPRSSSTCLPTGTEVLRQCTSTSFSGMGGAIM